MSWEAYVELVYEVDGSDVVIQKWEGTAAEMIETFNRLRKIWLEGNQVGKADIRILVNDKKTRDRGDT